MNKYSLKQFLLENKEQAENNFERSTSISRLIGGMQNNKTITENIDQRRRDNLCFQKRVKTTMILIIHWF